MSKTITLTNAEATILHTICEVLLREVDLSPAETLVCITVKQQLRDTQGKLTETPTQTQTN